MLTHQGYMAGANLGHWISQYGTKGEEHFNSYITEADVQRAAGLGFDHLRLPVDYFFFEDDAAPGVYREERIAYIDRTIAWTKKYGLNLVLDLHHAPGYFFGDGEKNTLFVDPSMQERFLAIWCFFAKRYKAEGYNLTFELLNELVWENSDPWNVLWQRAEEAIHEIDPARNIIVGGNFWNSVDELENLVLSPKETVWYTFHFYHPMLFTHQRAMWNEENRRYPVQVEYPVDTVKHAGYYVGKRPLCEDRPVLDKAFLRDRLAPAREFISRHGRALYCGEYGVYAESPLESAVLWHREVAEILLEMGIGRAVWSLRGFAHITNGQNEVVSEELVEAVTRKV